GTALTERLRQFISGAMRLLFVMILLSLLSARAAANAPFSIQEQDGISWLVRPNGERFFSFGVCVVNQGASRKEYKPRNPGYAGWQQYANSNQWAEATLKRLRSWGFTTMGGWS